MVIKITSTHKNESNLSVSDIHVSISELYIGINANTIQLRTRTYLVIDGQEFELNLLKSDPLYSCLFQNRTIQEWATDINTVQLSGTRYQIQAQLLFELIFNKIAEVNAETPNTITYELIGFPS